jgi:MATE family multidrug resistance protein
VVPTFSGTIFARRLASAIRVAFYYGEKNYQKSFDAGNVACAVAATYMFISGVCLSLGGKYLISVFTSDAIVISLAQKIVLVAALFQIADGVQVVLTGNLRGLGLTKMPALLNFIGYWVVGLPVGYWLCFYGGSKVIGLWIGLSVGLGFVAITLYILWRKKEKTWLRAV